ncbi:MAG TPA: hypothetical protein VGF27_26595 [Pseudoduganella sp.]
MTISSLNSSSAASQLSYVGKLQSSSGSEQTEGVRPPPPPREGGGFISAIADALKSIGVGSADSSTATTAGAADGATADSSAESSVNAAQALGGFLQELMGALHGQGSEASGPSPYGQPGGGGPGGPGGPGGSGGAGGPGKLAEDLQGLIAKLGSSYGTASIDGASSASSTSSASGTSGTSSASGTDCADSAVGGSGTAGVSSADGASTTASTDGASTTSSADSVSKADSASGTGNLSSLESSFKDLLEALGGDSGYSNVQLISFLQALSNKLPGAGSSGNMINTTA